MPFGTRRGCTACAPARRLKTGPKAQNGGDLRLAVKRAKCIPRRLWRCRSWLLEHLWRPRRSAQRGEEGKRAVSPGGGGSAGKAVAEEFVQRAQLPTKRINRGGRIPTAKYYSHHRDLRPHARLQRRSALDTRYGAARRRLARVHTVGHCDLSRKRKHRGTLCRMGPCVKCQGSDVSTVSSGPIETGALEGPLKHLAMRLLRARNGTFCDQ